MNNVDKSDLAEMEFAHLNYHRSHNLRVKM